MKVLLAGQNGIIGSYLFDELNSENEITGIGKGPFNSQNYFDIDLSNKNAVEGFVKAEPKFDFLIFLVGLAHAKGKNQDYPVFENINFLTLFNLLESMKQQNKMPEKIIFSSTISVYGEKIKVTEYKGTDELSPNSPYLKTKILAEKYLTKYFKNQSWILRFAPVYSNQFKLNIERRTKIKNRFYKVGDGTNKLSLLNIKNISYIIKEIIADKIPPDIYNLADTQNYDYDVLLKNSGASNILSIPKFIPIFAYYIGKLTNNIFLLENSVKLISDNIYSTKKLQKYTQLPFTIKNY